MKRYFRRVVFLLWFAQLLVIGSADKWVSRFTWECVNCNYLYFRAFSQSTGEVAKILWTMCFCAGRLLKHWKHIWMDRYFPYVYMWDGKEN